MNLKERLELIAVPDVCPYIDPVLRACWERGYKHYKLPVDHPLRGVGGYRDRDDEAIAFSAGWDAAARA